MHALNSPLKYIALHIATALHRSKASNENAPTSSNTSSSFSDNSNDEFKMDLCTALIAANIPWNVLSNGTFNNFLKKYTGQQIPDESTLKKNYLDKTYQQSIQKIRESIKDENVWISVDETTDKQGRYVANLIIRTLSEKESSSSFLLSCKQLEEVNNATVSRFVNDSIRILWPHGNELKVLLLLTDTAAYMIKAGKNLKVFYPNLIHITCLAHGLNLIAEKVRTSFHVANSFISCVKKIFIKAPLRVRRYKQILNKELPPEPIITRWGTWLKAASFYADNMEGIKEVLETLNPEDAESIKLARELIENPQLHQEFICIYKIPLRESCRNNNSIGSEGATIRNVNGLIQGS
ncbi:uncharacterized protein LOC117187204 [Drosophila miranda]|uniref:uncharacterized protein LOC117187146 n=1 Tax=Drosophila miranda TaxID=7229 RepID=UPI00143FB3A2|nr:uncharacterized protein LOC117187146 [Drosophila miranda]XP_033245266.1 uncharacterized protein LOC117187204 [Drosophila miranda]